MTRKTSDHRFWFSLLIIVLAAMNGVLFRVLRPIILPGASPFRREIKELAALPQTFPEVSAYVQNLAKKKGALYAYEFLKTAKLPPNTDMHLLGHVVGDELYRQRGKDGIHVCTEDFRNACSHAIVVGLFLEQGEVALDEIRHACEQAPGGRGAYTMCYHGLGHGILAAVEYEMPEAVRLCALARDGYESDGAAEQCISGAVMEIISGGFHNPALWEERSKKYLSLKNVFLPCTAAYMPERAKPFCYQYLTPHLIRAVGGSLENPKESDIAAAAALCQHVPELDQAYQDYCFEGFGKEFVVLSRGRDIRHDRSVSEESLRKVIAWCSLVATENGKYSCQRQAISSLIWGGENDPAPAARFCSLLFSTTEQNRCYEHLIGIEFFYISDKRALLRFCNLLPEARRSECLNRRDTL